MTYCFYICVSLFVVVFQTTVTPFFSLLSQFYDLLLLLVIYLGLFRSAREGIPVILLCGLIMDALSGTPFGLYTTAYVWLYIIVRWIIRYLHGGNIFLLPIVVVFGALMENAIFLAAITLANSDSRLSAFALPAISVQVLWALFTGPPLLVLLKDRHIKWDQWLKERSAERNGVV